MCLSLPFSLNFFFLSLFGFVYPPPSVVTPYFLPRVIPLLFFSFCLFLFFPFGALVIPSSLPASSLCRHLTSVSWDRLRRQISTVCSADRWGQCTCLEKLSALLRSLLSISWVRATRLESMKLYFIYSRTWKRISNV